jgi:Ring finger domain
MDSLNAYSYFFFLYRCSICLGDYEEKEMLRVIPACHHSFHLVCIDLWLQKQSTCPICRLPLKDIFDGKWATASSPTALVPQTNSSIAEPPAWDLSTNQQITNARANNTQVSGESVQVMVTST